MFDFDFDDLEELSKVKITVTTLDGKHMEVVKAESCTVKEVKESLEELYGIPSFEQRLCCGCHELPDRSLISSSSLQLLRCLPSEAEWLERVRQNPFALSQAPQCMKENVNVVREAMSFETSSLAYATEALRNDYHFAMEMVAIDGRVLRYLSPELQGQKEIVLLAVSSVGAMLKCAAEDLRRDPEVVLTAVQQDAKALMHADPELLHDTAFTRQVMASGHCLVIDVLLSLTVDGHRIEERRALEESRLEADARDSALALETAHRHFLRGDAIFLDARSVDEFDRSHISGAWSFSERSPLWARLASEREDLERTSNPALKQLVQFPSRLVIIYSDSGSDDLSLGYVSRCVRVAQELRHCMRRMPSLGDGRRVRRLVGGLNHWKRSGYAVQGDVRPLINGQVLVEGGLHSFLDLEEI